jgi:acyl-CoA thioester hydrolase
MNTSEPDAFPVDIRFSDLDAMGHVNNAVYFTYFEEGRKNLFFKHLATGERPSFNFILAKASCNYKVPLLLEDKAVMEVWVGDIGRKSFTFAYRIRDAANTGKVFADGDTVMVSYDYKENKSVEIPPDMREKLESLRR